MSGDVGPDAPWEQNFRRQVRRLREQQGLTQTDLARMVKERGLPFHQQTVQRIEKGERPVRLDEAYVIAECLGEQLSALTTTEAGIMIERIAKALSEARRLAQAIQSLAVDFDDVRTRLRDEIADLDMDEIATWSESDLNRLKDAAEAVRQVMRWTSEEIVDVSGRGDLENEWLYRLGEDDDGVDQ